MQTSIFAIRQTTVSGTVFSSVHLAPEEVDDVLANFPNFRSAALLGRFAPVSATEGDVIASTENADGSADILIMAAIPPTTTTTVTDANNVAS